MGIFQLIFCTALLALGKFRLGLGIEALRALTFVIIVFGNQTTTYTNRERRRIWSSRPGRWLIASSVVDPLIASTLATWEKRFWRHWSFHFSWTLLKSTCSIVSRSFSGRMRV